jgi:hypothetical protein
VTQYKKKISFGIQMLINTYLKGENSHHLIPPSKQPSFEKQQKFYYNSKILPSTCCPSKQIKKMTLRRQRDLGSNSSYTLSYKYLGQQTIPGTGFLIYFFKASPGKKFMRVPFQPVAERHSFHPRYLGKNK